MVGQSVPAPQLRGSIMKLLRSVKRFLATDGGATTVEYVVMVLCTIILCLTISLIVR
jgi:Flp pilus assembly pilin Flp